jgi:hypothetical protein
VERIAANYKLDLAYFQGILSLARIIKWDVDSTGALSSSLSPEEIMDKLEERVGPEGRKLFESFLRQVNELQVRQQLEAQAQRDENGGGHRAGLCLARLKNVVHKDAAYRRI